MKREKRQLNDTCEIDRLKIFVDVDEDELDDIAFKKKSSGDKKFLVFYIIVFILVLICTSIQIYRYFDNKSVNNIDNFVLKSSDSVLIIKNSGKVKNYSNAELYSNPYIGTNISSVSVLVDESSKSGVKYKYNVKYRIYKNDFNGNNNEKVFVKFSYSYDNENFTYINNVIRTTNGTIMPQMDGSYDITGLESTLNVVSNYLIESDVNMSKEIYWKAETIYKDLDVTLNNNIDADFTIEYNN